MSETVLQTSGYVCIPYLHSHNTIELKDTWDHSKNVEDMYFVTATFSEESRPYFPSSANHYILAKFKDSKKILKEIEKFNQDKPSFIFTMDEGLFERESQGAMNFVSVYYLEYGDSEEDVKEVANLIAKREKVGKAGVGHMDLCCTIPQKFTFPYGGNIVVLEVSSDKSHQSVNKYCEKTRRDVGRKGITLTNLVSLSILEKLK